MRCAGDDFGKPVEELVRELGELRHRIARWKAEKPDLHGHQDKPACDGADFLSKVFDSIQDGISILDKDLNIIRVNRVMEEWYSHTMPIQGKKCYEAYHCRDKPCDICPSLRAMDQKTVQSEIQRAHGGNRRKKWIEVFAFPLIDDRGDVTGVIEHVRDITRRKEAEDAMRESEDKYRSLIESISDMAWEIDQDDRITYVSARIRDLLGYEIEEVVGKRPFEFFLPEDRDRLEPQIYETLRARAPMELIKYRARGKDGRIVYMEANGVPVFNEDGSFRGYRGVNRDITDRMRAEESLSLMQHMIDNTLDEASLARADGRFCYVNDAKCASLGYTRDELLSMSVWDVDPEMTPDQWPARFQNLKKRGSLKVETLHRGKDGSTFPTEVWTTYLNFHGSEYVCAFVRDITERKRVEGALKAANAYNRSLIEASMDPLVTIAPDGRITDVNAATETVTGLPRERLVGTDFSDYFTEPAKAREGYRTVFNEGSVKDYALEIRHRDGHVTPVIYNAAVYRDEAGKVIGVFAAARDITERKKAGEALAESEQKFRALAESTRAGIVLYRGKKFIYANPMMEKITGYTKDDLITMDFWEGVHPEHRELVRARGLARQAGKDVPSTYEFKILARSGETRWVELSSTLIEYRGKPTILSTVFDITDRKRVEAELQEAKSQAELYLDLMGHDINNLNQIGIGFLELALGTIKMSREERDLIARPLDALEASTRLIANVRKLQKVKEGGLKFHDINLRKMIRDIVPRYAEVPGRAVNINYKAGCDCVVRANDLLDDVFSNIIGNAIKHSRGPLDIDVFVSNVKVGDTGYCLIAIEDNGPGIPDGLKERLFARFGQGVKKGDRKGLGMYLVNTLVQDFHGKVWVEDRVRDDHTRGTRFMIMLPAAERR